MNTIGIVIQEEASKKLEYAEDIQNFGPGEYCKNLHNSERGDPKKKR